MKGRLQRAYDPVLRNRQVHRVMKEPWRKYKVGVQRWEKAANFGESKKRLHRRGSIETSFERCTFSKD